MDEIRTALEDGEIQGALLDTYVAAEHKERLLDDWVFVKQILDRPFGYGMVLSGAARNIKQRCRDYIDLQISQIFHILINRTKTLKVCTTFESHVESFLWYTDCRVPFSYPFFGLNLLKHFSLAVNC